jgi:predicted RNA-binding protein with RPS1 domain
MIIYNVTINIDDSVHDQWLTWMMEKHIPEIMETGKFFKAKLVKVLVVEEMGGSTYSIQYFAENKEKLEEYYKEHAPKLREEGARMFGDKMLAFRTELELLKEFKSI